MCAKFIAPPPGKKAPEQVFEAIMFALVNIIKLEWYIRLICTVSTTLFTLVVLSTVNNIFRKSVIEQYRLQECWQSAAQHCCNLFGTTVNKLISTSNNLIVFCACRRGKKASVRGCFTSKRGISICYVFWIVKFTRKILIYFYFVLSAE